MSIDVKEQLHPGEKKNARRRRWYSKRDQITRIDMGVSKNRGKTPQMDGENNGKPYEQMDDLGGFPIFLETPTFLFDEI